ncbi:mechanosensitive ion channel family protein [Candidatus Chloroploca sp. Khr17]|uniref:mechanosensitive ion channel family protein n=1 Tax=Candidatus Chloroploca sp. Khr17 TaxID=2496869 RepID=UPI00196B7910|nr:mechanosensitive ion channel family protein [Candidatus Chloroploca sp. Khr17]
MPELEELETELTELLQPVNEWMTIFGDLTAIFTTNSPTRWLIALIIMAVIFLAITLLQLGLRWRFARHPETTHTFVDDAIAIITKKTKGWVKFVVAFYFGLTILILPDGLIDLIRTAAGISFLIQLGIWGNALITGWGDQYTQRNLELDRGRVATAQLLTAITRLVLYSIILLLILENLPGINITPLLASVGIGGIAIALAVQNILGDLFASLSITLDKPFVPGEFIVVGTMAGTVERIGIKTTRLQSISGEHLVFSNADLLNSRIQNFSRMQERRIVFSLGIIYETPPELLRKIPTIIRESIEAQAHTRFDRAHFQKFDNFALTFEVVYFVLSPEFLVYMDTQQAINLALFERFAAENIQFAYPTQMLYVNQANHDPLKAAPEPVRSP